jgi:hypothetical protein
MKNILGTGSEMRDLFRMIDNLCLLFYLENVCKLSFVKNGPLCGPTSTNLFLAKPKTHKPKEKQKQPPHCKYNMNASFIIVPVATL